jgi:hypothetical protein
MKYIGKSTYVWGGGRTAADIAAGRFDCSGFVNYAFKQAGINLGNGNTDTIAKIGQKVTGGLQVGDIVFFDTYKKNGHVGIYIGNGKFIGSQSSTGVAIADMNSGYWKDHYKGYAVRVGGGTGGGTSNLGNLPNSGGYTNYTKYGKQPSSFNTQMQQAISRGVPFAEAKGLTELIGRESSWNPSAKNPKSTAYGYGQFLSSTRSSYEKKMKMSYSDPVNQILMTYQYVKDRYGSVAAALKFWDKNKWY